MLLINTPNLRILIDNCHQTLNIVPSTQFTPPHLKKCSSNVSSKSFLFLKVGHLFIITLFPIVHLYILLESAQDRLVLRAKAPGSPSLARSKGAKSFLILFIPASPPQVVTLHPVPVLPPKGLLRLLNCTQEIPLASRPHVHVDGVAAVAVKSC